MPQVETVRGPIDTNVLGATLMHEHVFVLTADVQANLPQPFDEDARVAEAAEKLRALADLGVHTIVDPTVIGLGRNIARIKRVNGRSTSTSSWPRASTPTTWSPSTSASACRGRAVPTPWSSCSFTTSPRKSSTPG